MRSQSLWQTQTPCCLDQSIKDEETLYNLKVQENFVVLSEKIKFSFRINELFITKANLKKTLGTNAPGISQWQPCEILPRFFYHSLWRLLSFRPFSFLSLILEQFLQQKGHLYAFQLSIRTTLSTFLVSVAHRLDSFLISSSFNDMFNTWHSGSVMYQLLHSESSQQSLGWNLTAILIALGSGAPKRWLAHEAQALCMVWHQ